jgi:hypothetical protein
MNRQVLPSMLLSVLIVCFFAVILFEKEGSRPGVSSVHQVESKSVRHDEKPAIHGSRTSQADGSRRSSRPPAQAHVTVDPSFMPSSPLGGPDLAFSRLHQAAPPLKQTPRYSSKAVHTDKAPVESNRGTQVVATSRMTPVESTSDDDEGTSPVSHVLTTNEFKVARNDTLENGFNRAEAFTIVELHEELDDVALRVYGTSKKAETLWRANQDLIPRRNAPLPVGLRLRTPIE